MDKKTSEGKKDTTTVQNEEKLNPVLTKPTSTLTIVGFILAFIVPIAGFICSLIALVKINKENSGGKGLSIAGIVISLVLFPINTLFIIALIMAPFTPTESPKSTDKNLPKSEESSADKPTESAPKQVTFVYDVPSLKGKNIDEIRQILGKPTDANPEPTDAQKNLGVDEWDNEWSNGDYGILVYFDTNSRKVNDIFLTLTKTTYIQNVDEFLGKYNLKQSDSNYRYKLVYENNHEGDKTKLIGITVTSK